jgi:gliding motility-associated protein GldM
MLFRSSAFTLTLLISSVFYLSCTHTEENKIRIFKSLEEGMRRANEIIQKNNNSIYSSLEFKLAEANVHEKASVWQSKALSIQKISANMIEYIEELKIKLRKKGGLNSNNSYDVNNTKVVQEIFEQQENGKALCKKLLQYKNEALAVDSLIEQEFADRIMLVDQDYDSAKNKEDFTTRFFTNIPMIAAMAFLTKIQNNIYNAENRIATFCNLRVPNHEGNNFEHFSCLVGQSSTYLRTKENINIIAGIGAFTKKANAEIKINGRLIPLNDSGVASRKFSAGTPGKHRIPVVISFTDQDGEKETRSFNVDYTVVKNDEVIENLK